MRSSLRSRKRIQEIVLVLSLVGFYVYILSKVNMTNAWVTKLSKIVPGLNLLLF